MSLHGIVPDLLTRCTQNATNDIIVLIEDAMAGNLHVRNLDDDLITRLKRRAQRHGRSTEAEHREILRQALAGEDEISFDKLAADLRKLTRKRKHTPSEDLLREGRGER
jgi:antitoxin FitA